MVITWLDLLCCIICQFRLRFPCVGLYFSNNYFCTLNLFQGVNCIKQQCSGLLSMGLLFARQLKVLLRPLPCCSGLSSCSTLNIQLMQVQHSSSFNGKYASRDSNSLTLSSLHNLFLNRFNCWDHDKRPWWTEVW